MTVRNRFLVVLAALTLVVAVPASAQQEEEHPTGEEHATGQEEHPEGAEAMAGQEMTPEMQEMMAAWQEAGTPGEPHEYLAKLAGSWKTSNTMWMEPDAEPMHSEGKVERKMILNGRVLVEHFHGDMMGMPFEGMGLTGYDNTTDKFWGVWMDSMSTAAYRSTGTCSDDYSKCTYAMTGTDPMTGDEMKWRIETETIGEDSEKMTMYETRDGTEFKSMEMVYERTMRSQAAQEMKEKAAAMKEKAADMKQRMQEEESAEAPE